jgi:methyl-accepting chemotaxis protein
MAGIFKKAMGLFVEFEEDKAKSVQGTRSTDHGPDVKVSDPVPKSRVPNAMTLDEEALDKFEKHFEDLFNQANLPGPDYYEFWKMMETLEPHIKEERARISATYASLVIQGLTKEKLVDTAEKYKALIQEDKNRFEKAVNEKGEGEIGQKRQQLKQMDETIAQQMETIRKLTQEIAETQAAMGKLNTVIAEEERKLMQNKQGYTLACDAMLQKITDDVNKIQTTL